MTNQDLRSIIDKADLGKVNSMKKLDDGYTSDAFLINADQGKFVVLSKKPDGLTENSDYALNYAVLKTLEGISYKYAPRAYFINEDQSIFVMGYAPGKSFETLESESEDAQKQAVSILVYALLDLRAASYTACSRLYRQLTGSDLPTRTLRGNVQKYTRGFFDLAQQGKPDKEMTQWLKPKLLEEEAFARQTKPGSKIVLVHGDTSAGNIIVNGAGHLNLIDWGSGGFNQFPEGWDDYGLAYVMNMVPLFHKYREYVMTLVHNQEGIDIDNLKKRVFRMQQFMKLGDIMWTYMMHARASAGQIEDQPEKFMEWAQARIANYKRTEGDG